MDTLTISQTLQTAGLEKEPADAIAKTIKNEVKIHHSKLVSTNDISLLQKDIKDLRWFMGAGFAVMGAGFGYMVSLLNTIITKLV